MNSKDRFTVALEGGCPDRVPITLGLSEMVPVRYFGGDYVQFLWKDKIPLWKATFETECTRFGADGYLNLSEGPSPHDPPVELRDVNETASQVTYTSVIRTRLGDLSARYYLATASPLRTRHKITASTL